MFLVSCVSIPAIPTLPKFEEVRKTSEKQEEVDLTSYNIGQIQVKNVGEVMFTRRAGTATHYYYYKAIKSYEPPNSPSYPGFDGFITPEPINEGSKWSLYGTTNKGDKIYTSDTYKVKSTYNLEKYKIIDIKNISSSDKACIVSDASDQFYGTTDCDKFYVFAWPQKLSNILKPLDMFTKYHEGSFKQVLVYNGKSENTIKMQYREYNDDLARPAFFQDLIYNISESKEIGFRGMRINIIEANNLEIKFVIKTKINSTNL